MNLARLRATAPVWTPLTKFTASWQLALETAAKSPHTVRGYTDSVRRLCKFLAVNGMAADVEGVDALALPMHMR